MIINMNGAKAPETPSSVLQEKTVTPETLPTVIGPDEGYDGLSQVTVNPDAQLKAENIRSGKTIFGVTGAFNGNGDKTDLEVKYLTCLKGIENDYTITGAEVQEFFKDGQTFNGYPYTILPWGRVGTLDFSNVDTGKLKPGAVMGLGDEYKYPFTLKLRYPGNSSSSPAPDTAPFSKCAIQQVELAPPPGPFFSSVGSTFYRCAFFTDLVMPEGYTNIFGYWIYDCYKNTTVGNYNPTGLTVVLPSTLTEIQTSGRIHFNNNCPGTIIMKATTPPNLADSSSIQNCAKIVVPAGSLNAYKTATNWKSFANIMEEATQ